MNRCGGYERQSLGRQGKLVVKQQHTQGLPLGARGRTDDYMQDVVCWTWLVNASS